MINPNTVTHGTERSLDAVADGLKLGIPTGITSLLVGGVTYTVADLEKKVAEVAKPWKDVRAAHAVIRAAMASREADERAALSFLSDLRSAIVTLLGRKNEELTRFGLTPEKARRQLTPAELVVRAEKARLTRELRGTKGKRQKEALRADGTPAIVIGATGPGATITPMPTNPVSSVSPPPPPPPPRVTPVLAVCPPWRPQRRSRTRSA